MKSFVEYESRGALVDRTTQRWVQATGRRVALDECSWLEGPVGDVDVIGADFFARFADREGLTIVADGPPRGLVEDFGALAGQACDPSQVDARVAEFYEQPPSTSSTSGRSGAEDSGPSAVRWLRSLVGDCSN